MARRDERTSKKVASKAAAALKDPKASKREKSIAGSALTQRETKPIDIAKHSRLVNALREFYAALAALNPRRRKAKTKVARKR
jgi:hypothetical protein